MSAHSVMPDSYNTMDCIAPLVSSAHGIFQARRLEWVAISFSRGSGFPDPGIKPASLTSPALAGRFFNTGPSGKHIIAHLVLVKSYLSHRDICSPISHPWKQLSWGSPWLLWIHLELLNVACGVLCLVAQSCLTLCNPMDCSLPGSSVHGISQTSRLEWVAISFSSRSSRPRDWTHISCIGKWILYHWANREAFWSTQWTSWNGHIIPAVTQVYYMKK